MVMPLNNIQQARFVLREGGVILHPTETCYGFACDAMNEAAVKKLYELKKMPLFKPSSILISNIEAAVGYGEFSPLAHALAMKYWPGPLTIVVPRKNIPLFLNPGTTTIGMRIPGHVWTLDLLKMCDFPLITTSANVSGQPQAYEVSEVLNQLGEARPDFIIDSGKIPEEKPSTVLEIIGDSMKIIREGPVSGPEISDFANAFLRSE